MIDRIRQDIQARLDQLLAEADRLRQALSALGGDHGASRSATRSSSSSASSSDSASPTPTRTRAARGSSARARTTTSRGTSRGGARAASGGTKNSVLNALGEASGKALTASEVAAATGLGRASVSTTLSKLARAGEVEKADRGYRLAAGATSSNGDAPAAG